MRKGLIGHASPPVINRARQRLGGGGGGGGVEWEWAGGGGGGVLRLLPSGR